MSCHRCAELVRDLKRAKEGEADSFNIAHEKIVECNELRDQIKRQAERIAYLEKCSEWNGKILHDTERRCENIHQNSLALLAERAELVIKSGRQLKALERALAPLEYPYGCAKCGTRWTLAGQTCPMGCAVSTQDLEEIINGMPFSPEKSKEWREWFRRIYRGHALDLDAAFKHYDFNGLEDDVLDKLQEVYHGPAKAEYCPKHVRVMERPILKDECDQCKEEQS